MTRISHVSVSLAALILLASGGCGLHGAYSGPADKPVYRSSRKAPDWITRRPSIPGTFVSVGIGTGAPSLEEGQRAAVREAVSEIVTYLGIRAEITFEQTETELTTLVTNQITARGAGRVTSGRTVEMYYEKRRRIRSGAAVTTYDVYVLIGIPMDELEAERLRIAEEIRVRRMHAARLLEEGLQARREGDLEGALSRWLTLLDGLENDGESSALMRKAVVELSRLVDDLRLEFKKPEHLPAGQLTVTARLAEGEAALPVPHLPVRIWSSRGGSVLERARTDADGAVSIRLPEPAGAGEPLVVRASVDAERILGGYVSSDGSAGESLIRVLDRLDGRRAEIVLATSAEGRAEARIRPDSSSATASRSRRVTGPADVVGDAIEAVLLAGHERIYAPRGRPTHCASFVLEISSAAAGMPERPPLNVALVLDRSGSMDSAAKLTYLKMAATLLVDNLLPRDVFSLVTYADDAKVVTAAGTASNRTMIEHRIEMMRAAGTTNLGEGLIRGFEQAERYHTSDVMSRVILISDGLANTGVTEPSTLALYAARGAERGISLTTIGLGEDFDEELLMTLANEGYGAYYYVKDADELPRVLSSELHGLLNVVVRGVTVDLQLASGVSLQDSLGSPFYLEDDRVLLNVGDLAVGETVRIAFQLGLPSARPGPIELGVAVVGFEDIGRPGQRWQRDLVVRSFYTEQFDDAERSANTDVNRIVQGLAIMDSMLQAQRSGDRAAIEEVLRYIDTELPRFRAWASRRDDQEMRELVRMLEHCSMVLRAEQYEAAYDPSTRAAELAKEISYRLYRLRRHPVMRIDQRPRTETQP